MSAVIQCCQREERARRASTGNGLIASLSSFEGRHLGMMTSGTVHASAVLVGARAVLIRGPSGGGKSRLAWELIHARRSGVFFARLVGDDRVHLRASHGRLLVRPADPLAGLIELRGVGILRCDYEPCAVVGLVVDLAVADAERLPARGEAIVVEGVMLPRLAVAPGVAALPLVVAMLTSGSAL